MSFVPTPLVSAFFLVFSGYGTCYPEAGVLFKQGAYSFAFAISRVMLNQLGISQNLQPQLAGRKIAFENRRILYVFEDHRKQFDAPDDED